MIRITQIKLPPGHTEKALRSKIQKALKLKDNVEFTYTIAKQSIDARKKPDIILQYTVDVIIENEKQVIAKAKNPQVIPVEENPYVFPTPGRQKLSHRPVIIGTGPAGLFCGYMLAKHGYQPILLERGEAVDKRSESVETFWKTGKLNPESNVQFGEGGAGTFSDGKLNTLVKDKLGRNKEVLRIFVEAGAPEQILYESKPHIGTDILMHVVEHMRNTIIDCGGQVRFDSKVTDIKIENHCIKGVVINHNELLETDIVVLAIGHSARDTFEMLLAHQIPMEAKAFAIGLRVEHKQSMMNAAQYGIENPKHLPPAPYKVTAKAQNGRGVYSFCMCPGGYVVNASSEAGRLAINGMSYSKRNGENANSAIIVTVTPEDYCGIHYEDASQYPPLSGIAFQRKLEEKAFSLAGGKVPVQTYGDFKKHTIGSVSDIIPQIKGAYTYADVSSIMPAELNEAFIDGMEQFNKVIAGFASDNTLLEGIESRTSSPIRIHRGENFQSVICGLYPCGEGAGYAGGITSAAMDGMKIAEEIAKKYMP